MPLEVAKLSREERHQILYNHVRLGDQASIVRRTLKPYLPFAADQQPFWPEVARRLGRQAFTRDLEVSQKSVVDFMAHPNSYLGDIYQALPADHIGALEMVYRAGELPAPLDVSSNSTRQLLDLVGATPDGVARALRVLEGTFLRRGPVALIPISRREAAPGRSRQGDVAERFSLDFACASSSQPMPGWTMRTVCRSSDCDRSASDGAPAGTWATTGARLPRSDRTSATRRNCL